MREMGEKTAFVSPRGINVLGGALQSCSTAPLTGFFRDGCCRTDDSDTGVHTVCVVATAEFLEFSRRMGNDLSTPRPEFGFPGLRPGDRWCVCAARWVEALRADAAPPVVLAATHVKTLGFVDLDTLMEHAVEAERH
jgi:uncharacterized protein (DUF2237 family)